MDYEELPLTEFDQETLSESTQMTKGSDTISELSDAKDPLNHYPLSGTHADH